MICRWSTDDVLRRSWVQIPPWSEYFSVLVLGPHSNFQSLLATVFASEKCHQLAYGRHVLVNTDHKPLEAIFKKPLDRAPKCLQGMLLRVLAYDTDYQYTSGHTQHLAEMMSRSFILAGNQGTPNEFEAINAV